MSGSGIPAQLAGRSRRRGRRVRPRHAAAGRTRRFRAVRWRRVSTCAARSRTGRRGSHPSREIPARRPRSRALDSHRARIRPAAGAAAADGGDRVVRLERGVRRWRMTPRPPRPSRRASRSALPPGGTAAFREPHDYLAVVDRGGDAPALIVRVDLGRLVVQVRSLAVETPSERSLELWADIYVGLPPRDPPASSRGGTVRLPIPASRETAPRDRDLRGHG